MRRSLSIAGVALVLALLLTGGIGLYLYLTTGNIVPGRTSGEQEATRVVAAVGKHLYLPEGEEPTVATVTDLAPLAGQPFFAKAQVGHKVLIYTQSAKAILYDPVADKIVEVAPLNLGTTP
jgi:hypothetical protein